MLDEKLLTGAKKSFAQIKKLGSKWSEPKDCGDGDLLWCSCASRVFPYDIEHAHALADLQKFGGKSDCCGLVAFRSGLFDVGRFLTNNLIDRFSECRFNRLVVMCGSCQDMFQLALPEYFGREFPFEVVSVYQYLDEQIQSGKENIVAYCYGCFTISRLFQGGTTHFLLEKLLWALGDEIKYPMSGILGRSMNFSNLWHMTKIGPSALF
ncbi:MAG: heterodisulfide reductase-related iron-sulfur binding cluster [Dissulfuribacterales bacterium]